MARKNSASASTARKTVKAPARRAAPLLKAAKTSAATAPAAAASPARAAAATTTPAVAAATGKGIEDFLAVGQDNLKACVTYGTLVAKGLETLGNEVMTLTQARIEANLAAGKSIMAAKTLDEVVELQTGFAQDRLQGIANETAKIGALTMRIASQALEPLRSRFDANSRTVLRPFG